MTITEPNQTKPNSSLYLFRFDVHSPLMHGACHVVDLPYVFGQYKMLAGSICPKVDG